MKLVKYIAQHVIDNCEQYDDNLMWPIIKRLIHDRLLFNLQENNLLTRLILRGGSVLNKIYFSPRFSGNLKFICQNNLIFSNQEFIKFSKTFYYTVTEVLNQEYSLDATNIDFVFDVKKFCIVINLEKNENINIIVENESRYNGECVCLPSFTKTNGDFSIVLTAATLTEIFIDNLINLIFNLNYASIYDLTIIEIFYRGYQLKKFNNSDPNILHNIDYDSLLQRISINNIANFKISEKIKYNKKLLKNKNVIISLQREMSRLMSKEYVQQLTNGLGEIILDFAIEMLNMIEHTMNEHAFYINTSIK